MDTRNMEMIVVRQLFGRASLASRETRGLKMHVWSRPVSSPITYVIAASRVERGNERKFKVRRDNNDNNDINYNDNYHGNNNNNQAGHGL